MATPDDSPEIDIDPARVAAWLTEDPAPQVIDVREPYEREAGRSTMAAQAFRGSGYEAYSMAGGLRRWADEGRPLAPDGGSVADH